MAVRYRRKHRVKINRPTRRSGRVIKSYRRQKGGAVGAGMAIGMMAHMILG
jgi:hypothetical protein